MWYELIRLACRGHIWHKRALKGRDLVNCYLYHTLERWPPLYSRRRNSLSKIYTCKSYTMCVRRFILCISYFQHASEGASAGDTASLGAGLCAWWQGQRWLPNKSVVCVFVLPVHRIRVTSASRILPVLFRTHNNSPRFAVPCLKLIWLPQSLLQAMAGGDGSWGLLLFHSVRHYWLNNSVNSSCDGNSRCHVLRAREANTVLSLCVFSHWILRLVGSR